jgi:hypothetical protein
MRLLARLVHLGTGLSVFLCASLAQAAATAAPNATTVDGGSYYGPLVNGRFQGPGRIEWANGARYEGNFAEGLYSGQGRLRFASGDVYEGGFLLGLMAGRGRMQMRDGTVYVGEFRDDLFNGQGRQETVDGEVYEGAFENGRFHGSGRLAAKLSSYRGDFRQGMYWGRGELSYGDRGRYRGEFVQGRFHGKGRFENRNGEVFEGDFDGNEFTGGGTVIRPDGLRCQGRFLRWRLHGAGSCVDGQGNVYEGQFADDALNGAGRLLARQGGGYEGEFRQWRFHGEGVLRHPNGDVYQGRFADGLYEGPGTLTYARPRPDGRTQDSGVWRQGMLDNRPEQRQAQINVEAALYNQRRLLDEALAAVAPSDPRKIDLYLLAVAGDGSQEVFRREVEFVRRQFARDFGTQGRSVVLVNSRNTAGAAPMATLTSIRESLKTIAARMDRERDILFMFLTSHGSKEHELVLSQDNMGLRSLPARELGALLKASGIRWRVVVVSACYSGGFIEDLKDDHTLVITAARHDRQSFGCADENDFTYFGRAFFKEALPGSRSFEEAFRKAETLIREWELKDHKTADTAGTDSAPGSSDRASLPQIVNPAAISAYLQRWRGQLAKGAANTEQTE